MSKSAAEKSGYELRIEPDQCIGCAICADVCPSAALVMDLDDVLPRWIPALCHACSVCMRQCPTGAIEGTRRARRAARVG
jgi:NAD-dependent dihydropyrimidine dehydrogenase PreA subunit